MFQYRSDSLQVKRNVISSIANVVYELPHDFPVNLRLTILGNKKILGNLKFGWKLLLRNLLYLYYFFENLIAYCFG